MTKITLEEECRKYGVHTTKYVSEKLDINHGSAEDVINSISAFCEKWSIGPTNAYFSAYAYDNSVDITLEANIPQANDKMRAELKARKIEVGNEERCKAEKDKREYERLKKKFAEL